MKHLFLCCAVIGTFLLVGDPAAGAPKTDGAGAVNLLSHRALYSLSLHEAKSHSGLVQVRGAMLYRFERSCDGWISENSSVVRFLNENDQETESTWNFTSWESLNGQQFRFRVREAENGTPVEGLQGEARLPTGDGAGEVLFTEPVTGQLALPPETLFPTMHLKEVLKAATSGGARLHRMVFDGSISDHAYEISALIVPVPEKTEAEIAKDTGLPRVPAWWVHMAFYAPDAEQGLPAFEVAIRYRRDGVADRVIQNFGDFSLALRMTDIEQLSPPAC